MSSQYVDPLAPGVKLASVISIFGRDAVLRLCAWPVAIFGGWRCKAGLQCRVPWVGVVSRVSCDVVLSSSHSWRCFDRLGFSSI
jgi:hypothetical protein